VAGKGEPALTIDGANVAVAVERWPESEGLVVSDLAGSKGLVGLLRYDGGAWSIQPLTIAKGKAAPRMLASEIAAALGKKSSSSSLSTLKERAGKLLRKKR
ncbi:MAG: hypothetical protein KC420_15725, partial [Myxococcales bacterium]|nr:hypothetical protein [Myxococcales bacterium]